MQSEVKPGCFDFELPQLCHTLCATWRQRAAAQLYANTASCRPSTRPVALCCAHCTAHIPAHAVSRHKRMNRTEGMHQFHAVFACSHFSLMALPFWHSTVVSLSFFPHNYQIFRSNFKFPWKFYVNLEEYDDLGHQSSQTQFFITHLCETCLSVYLESIDDLSFLSG